MQTLVPASICHHGRIRVATDRPTAFIDVTARIEAFAAEAGIRAGLVNVQSLHTTTAIVVNEHEPLLLTDFDALLSRAAPRDASYRHDDMDVRTVNLAPGEPVYRGWRGILLQMSGRRTEGEAVIRQAAAELDCFSTLDRWQRHWRHRFAESLGDTAAAARLARVPDQASSEQHRYDANSLPGQTGSLVKRRS